MFVGKAIPPRLSESRRDGMFEDDGGDAALRHAAPTGLKARGPGFRATNMPLLRSYGVTELHQDHWSHLKKFSIS